MNRLILFLLILLPFSGMAQSDHRISPQEKNLMPDYLLRIRQNSSTGITTPPVSPVRASAEWEEIDALMIAWTTYPAILTQIVQAAQPQARVIILCDDSNSVKSTLTSAGVSLSNINFVIAPFNSIWCRDYGQWNIYTNDVDSLALIDWIYNRPRPKDDSVPASVQNFTTLPMYQTTTPPYDLIHTGGNFMCDGFGTGFSSNLIIDENPAKTEAQIDTIMKKFMGINRYIKMNNLPYDGIHHIDMHMKLLDEETILMGEYPSGIADGPQIEANLQYVLSNFNSVFGTPYKVVRIPMPPDAQNIYPNLNGDYRTYTNSVFVNQTVILPVYEEEFDTTAIRIYRESLPGYTIVPIDCNNIIPSLGAIHCITKEVASSDPLLISHQRLNDTYNTSSPYTVNAFIKHRSGITNADIYYRTDTTLPFQAIAMTNSSGDSWTGNIPAQPANSVVYYYVEGNSTSGKTQVRPITGAGGCWSFKVLFNTGISENNKLNFSLGNIYPNPSHGITCVPVVTNSSENISIRLKNILGEDVINVFEGINSGAKNYFFNSTLIAPGVYILELLTENSKYTQQIVIR